MNADISLENFGYSSCMGPKLREFVERSLLRDLDHYLTHDSFVELDDVYFDWSDSCIEGHRTSWLDGEIENFSGIGLYDRDRKLIAEGWMEFIETQVNLEVFWWFLYSHDNCIIQRTSNHVPVHIWEKLSDDVRIPWAKYSPIPAILP